MTIEWWLPIGLIAPAIVAIALAVRRKSWFARRKYVVAIVMSAVSALLLAALAHPTIPAQEPSTPRLIIVADVSASMVAAQDWREVVGWIESVLPAKVELTVIPFAGRPSERPLRRDQVRLAADGSQGVADSLWPGRAALGEMETNLQQALHMAAAVAGDDVRRSAIIVYSDGWWTDNHQSAAVEALRRRGLSVGALSAVKSDLPNARIVNLTAPARVDVGQPLEIEAMIEANRDGEVELLLAAAVTDAESASVRSGRTVNLEAGRPRREKFIWQPTNAGLASVTVGVNMPGDAIASDDKWQLPVQVGLRRPLLVIYGGGGGDNNTGDGTATVARQLASLSAGERSAELTSAMNAPQTAAALGRYAAVVLVNVSRLELGDRLERALDGYVREMGGGLLVVGGGNAFGLGGYAGGLIDELLPLTSRTEHRPPIHLALVLDRSASMIEAAGGRQKLEIAKDAVGALERVLIDGDRLSLVAFNHDYQVVLDTVGTGGSGDWNRVRQAVAPLVPQGGTSLGPALAEALIMLERGPESVDGRPLRRHVIVISDGESDPFDIAATAARAAREQISISVVATGGRQAASLTELAARGGGRYYDAAAELADPLVQNRLAQIFMDDLPLELMIGEASPIRTTGAGGGGTRAAIQWPHDDEGKALPPVPAYLVTQAKGRAAVHLEAAAPEASNEVGNGAIAWHPLAASWQLGLGRAAAMPVAADVPEVIDWLKLPQIAPGMTSTIQWLASEDAGHADFEAVVRVEQGVLHAEVRQRRLPDAPAASPGMRLALYSLENRRTIALPLKLVAPGHWRRRLTLSGGAYSYVLRSVETGDKRGGDGSGSDELAEGRLIASGTVSGGVAAELRHQGINGPALARLAEAGGGGVLTSPAQAAEIELPQEVRRDLRPLLVVVALMLLLGQLAADLLAGRRRS